LPPLEKREHEARPAPNNSSRRRPLAHSTSGTIARATFRQRQQEIKDAFRPEGGSSPISSSQSAEETPRPSGGSRADLEYFRDHLVCTTRFPSTKATCGHPNCFVPRLPREIAPTEKWSCAGNTLPHNGKAHLSGAAFNGLMSCGPLEGPAAKIRRKHFP